MLHVQVVEAYIMTLALSIQVLDTTTVARPILSTLFAGVLLYGKTKLCENKTIISRTFATCTIKHSLWEWTQESAYITNDSSLIYNLRGGSFLDIYSNAPVCYRAYAYTARTDTLLGFRSVLYIK